MKSSLLPSLLAALWLLGMAGTQAFPLHYNPAQAAEEEFPSEQREEQTLRSSSQNRHRSRGKTRQIPFTGEIRQFALAQTKSSQLQFTQFDLSPLCYPSMDSRSQLRVLRI